MKTTIELAKQVGAFTDALHAGRCDNTVFTSGELETFRALCVAERDRELIGVGMEPALKLTGLVSGDSHWYSLDQLAAARLQDQQRIAELRAERDALQAKADALFRANIAINDQCDALQAQLAEKREALTHQQVVDAFCNLPHNVQYISVFDAGVRFAEKRHNIGGKHD
jgi:hypothetical protein